MKSPLHAKTLAFFGCCLAGAWTLAMVASPNGLHDAETGNGRILSQEKKKEEAAKPVSIPKADIYTTSAEPGFKKQLVALFRPDKDGRDKGEHPYSYDLARLENQGMGASNVFLVRGEEIKDAISGTRLVFERGVGADEPRKYDAEDREIVSKRYWLVVYLGNSGSEPPIWQFKSMSLGDRTIEFTYSKSSQESAPLMFANTFIGSHCLN